MPLNGFHIIIRKVEPQGFEAVVAELPGLSVFGLTIEEVQAAVRKRIESWMGLTRRLGWVVNMDFVLQEGAVYRNL